MSRFPTKHLRSRLVGENFFFPSENQNYSNALDFLIMNLQQFPDLCCTEEKLRKRGFRPNSPLKVLLNKRFPRSYKTRRVFYLHRVLNSVYKILVNEKTFDPTNSLMIIFNDCLASVFGMTLCSIDQLTEIIMLQLVPKTDPMLKTPYVHQASDLPTPPSVNRAKSPGLCIIDRCPAVPFDRPLHDNSLYSICDEFRELIKPLYPLENLESNTCNFWHQTVISYVTSKYDIIFNKCNLLAYMIADDPLGKILKIQSFHCSQAVLILKLLIVSTVENTPPVEYEIDILAAQQEEDRRTTFHDTRCSSDEDTDINTTIIINTTTTTGVVFPENQGSAMSENTHSRRISDGFEADIEIDNEDGVSHPTEKINTLYSTDRVCLNCAEVLTSAIKYCSPCWELRKSWIPNQPKRKRKRIRTRSGTRSNGDLSQSQAETIDLPPNSDIEGKAKKTTLDLFQQWVANISSTSSRKIDENKEFLSKLIDEYQSYSSSGSCRLGIDSGTSEPIFCTYCINAKSNAGFVHGNSVHKGACYKCAKKIFKQHLPCPLCRRKIEKIVMIC